MTSMSLPGRYELALTHSGLNFPEALRDAAFEHLSRTTGHTLAQLQQLFLQQPQPVVAVATDETAALRLQADLQRGGWQSEVRRAAAPAPGGATASLPPPPQAATVACPACHSPNPAGGRFCAQCGAGLGTMLPPLPSDGAGMVGATAATMARVAGLNGIQRFSMGELLSEVFKRRTATEVEDHFLVGTLKTTPAVHEMQADWPKPWLFARLFMAAGLTFLMMYAGLILFKNPNFYPGLMIVGCFVVPFSALLLLYELNAARNVSWMLIMRLTTLGGALSLLVSVLLFKLGADLTSMLGASAAGLIEETGKLAAVLYATRKLSAVRYRYVLNGVVFGAAVGAGFAIFESAGYAFNALLDNQSADAMMNSIYLRGLLSPFCHVIWTAMAAGALWRVKGARSYSGTMLADWRFLRVFLVNVLCHVAWNSPFTFGHPVVKWVLLGFVAWATALSLVQEGLRQIQREQQNCGPAPVAG